MKPATLFLLLLALAGAAVGWVAWRDTTEARRRWERLLALEGWDLRKDAEAAALVERFAARPLVLRDPPACRPWRVYRVAPDTPAEHVLLVFMMDEDENFFRPWVRVDVLEPPGRVLSSDEFGLGYGTYARAVVFESGRLVVATDLPDGVHYFKFVDGALQLLRIEDPKGKLQRNEFVCTPAISGPIPPNLPPEIWERDLSSKNPDVLLARLAFLGAAHPPHAQAGTRGHLERNAAIRAARAHPGVKARVEELRNYTDLWIREAAAAVPLDGSP